MFATSQNILGNFYKERRSELSCEGHRFFDLDKNKKSLQTSN